MGASTWLNMKLVRPITRTLSTTPTITWSTKYLIANKPSTAATSRPATMAAARPAQVEPVSEPTMAAPNAPNSSWPSMAMFTTPDRSPSTPPRAPKTSGTATAREPPSRPTTGIVPPAAAHVRKPVTHATAKMTTSHSVVFFVCMYSATDAAVHNAHTRTRIHAVAVDGTVTVGSCMKSPGAASRNDVSPS